MQSSYVWKALTVYFYIVHIQVFHAAACLIKLVSCSEYKDKYLEVGVTGGLLSEFDEEILEKELSIKFQINRIELLKNYTRAQIN